MSILTNTRNLRYILSLSLASRIIVILLQAVSNVLMKDHDADAYRNHYLKFYNNQTHRLEGLESSYRYSYVALEGLTKWDGQYFLEIAKDGYLTEQHLAFLPLFPYLVKLVKNKIYNHEWINFGSSMFTPNVLLHDEALKISIESLREYIITVKIAVILNNFIFFPTAALFLFYLTRLVKRCNDIYARRIVWWFCFNPASIFFSACYTESLFAALTFCTIYLLEKRSQSVINQYESSKQSQYYMPLVQINRILKICLPTLAFLALSTATRSNGLINMIFLLNQFFLKYIPLLKGLPSNQISFLILMSCEILQDAMVILISTVISASGFVTFQIYSYMKFCINLPAIKKGFMVKPEWCNNVIPQAYGYVQAKYWNVGLFKYYQFKQLPNFLLAFPITMLVFYGSHSYTNELRGRVKRNHSLHSYYIQTILFTIICSLTVNIQVTTRLLASCCPLIYWICEDLSEKSISRRNQLKFYFLVYFFIGTILHSNFYPWT